MSTVEGGLRDRLIAHSLHALVEQILDALGWRDAGRRNTPVTLIDRDPADTPEEVPAYNTVAVFDDGGSAVPWELGSPMVLDTVRYYVDVLAASDSEGRHISGDLREALAGRMPSIGRSAPTLTVYDWRQATPVELFVCEVVDITRDRGHDPGVPWRRYWWSISFALEDFR